MKRQSIPAYLRPYADNTLWGDMSCGYGAIATAPEAENIGEYGGWVSVAKQALMDLGFEVENTFDIIDDDFTFNVNAFQEQQGWMETGAVSGELISTPSGVEPGYLDPYTTKWLQGVYKTVYGKDIELMPVYPTETGIAVGWPAPETHVVEKESGVGKAFMVIGAVVVGVVAINLIASAAK